MRKCSYFLVVAIAISSVLPTQAFARRSADISSYAPGTIVVKTHERRYVTGNGTTIKYPVGVGKAGMRWTGTAYVAGKYIKPAWSPPEIIRREKPGLPMYSERQPRKPDGSGGVSARSW
jgi:lipoprotein-anchoring transpeptidase ErfK/SrfK